MTALREALNKAGYENCFLPADYELGKAIIDYLNDGNTVDRAHTIVDAAAKMCGAGQTNGDVSGQNNGANSGHSVCAVSVPASLDPTPGQNAAMARAKNLSAMSVFDRELTHTGRRWGNVFYREYDSMVDDGDVARALKSHIGSLRGDDRHKTTRELVTPREFLHLLRKTRGAKNAT
jgi:hypothetical protein